MKTLLLSLCALLPLAVLAQPSPGTPPTRLAPGSNVSIVTNGVNNFTISASGGGSTTDGSFTNLSVYSSGTTNQPLRVWLGTQTNSNPVEISGVWNNSGVNFTGLKLNVTNTASGGSSKLVDLQVGGANKFSISPDGYISVGSGTPVGALNVFSSDENGLMGVRLENSTAGGGQYGTVQQLGSVGYGVTGWPQSLVIEGAAAGGTHIGAYYGDIKFATGIRTPRGRLSSAGNFVFAPALQLSWSSAADFTTAADTALARRAAGVVEVNNGTANTLRDLVARSIYTTNLYATNAYVTAGTSTSYAKVAGRLNVDTTQTGNVGVGVDTLQTYSVAANTLSANGDVIAFRYTGSFANTVNTKQIILTFGATTLLDTGALGFPFADWRIEGEIVRTGAATQKISTVMFCGEGQATLVKQTTAAETLSGAVTLLLTAEATDDSDAVKEIFTLDYKPAP